MTQSHSVKVSDRKFSTITEAAEFYGVPLSTAAKRLGKGWTPEQAFGIDESPSAFSKKVILASNNEAGEQFQSKIIKVKGTNYGSIAEFARAHNQKPQLVRSRIHRGMSPSEAVGLGVNVAAEERTYKIDGNTFTTIDQLAKHYSANPNKVQDRLENGWSVAQAVGLMMKPKTENPYQDVITLSVKGKHYASMNDIAIAFDIKPTDLAREIAAGKTPDEAVKLITVGRKSGVLGEAYKSLNQRATHFGLNVSSFYQRVNRGETAEEAVNYLIPKADDPSREPGKRGRRGNPVEFEGQVFSSIRDFAKKNKMSPHKVAYRLKLGWSYSEAIEKTIREGFNKTGSSIGSELHENLHYQGKEYRSVRSLATTFNVSPHKVRYRLKNGWSVGQAIERTKAPETANKPSIEGALSKQVKIGTLLPFEINGLSFDTAKKLAEHFGMNPAKVTGRLRNGWSVAQAVEEEAHDRVHKQHITGKLKVGRKRFSTVIELAETYNTSYRVVQYRLSQGATPSQSVGIEPWSPGVHKGKKISFRDKTYPSLVELSKAYGTDYNKMSGRIHRGWTLEEALGLSQHKAVKAQRLPSESSPSVGTKKGNDVDDMLPDLIDSIKLGRRKFKSISLFAEHLNLDPLITMKRLNAGWTPMQIAGKEPPPNW
jgi:hypothetical protein